jgi:hypothetical protein
MQSRLVSLTLALFLAISVVGCNKKTDQSSNQSTDQTANNTASAPAPAAPAPAPEPPKPAFQTLTVPSGTTLTIRLAQALGSKLSQAGQSFGGTLSSAIAVQGKTVIPSGANVSGTVVDAKPLGRFKGGALLQVQLTSVNIDGTDRAIQTSSVSQTEKGKGKRTAIGAGGGAALGGIIGGLAGGGKGAVIGLLAGGGAGTAGAAFTGNKEIVLPAESVLSFQLTQPLDVKVKQ